MLRATTRISLLCALVCFLLPTAGHGKVVPGTQVGQSTQYDIADQCPPDTSLVYDQVVQDTFKAIDDGSLTDPRLLDHLLTYEDELRSDWKALSELVMATTVAPADGADDGDGTGRTLAQKDGGTVPGIRWSFRNIFGYEIGSGQIQISWNNNANACHSKISGASHTGTIPLGTCKTKRVGATFTRNCSPTADCESRTRECGNYQIECTQSILFCRLTEAKTRLETICAPCP